MPPHGGMRQRVVAEARSRTPMPRQRQQDPTPPPSGGMRQRVMPQRAASSGATPADAPLDVAAEIDGNDFRSHVARLFLLNEFSAKGAQQIFATAERAGAKGVSDLTAAGFSGKVAGNIHRAW